MNGLSGCSVCILYERKVWGWSILSGMLYERDKDSGSGSGGGEGRGSGKKEKKKDNCFGAWL